jgi:hypothetical protein
MERVRPEAVYAKRFEAAMLVFVFVFVNDHSEECTVYCTVYAMMNFTVRSAHILRMNRFYFLFFWELMPDKDLLDFDIKFRLPGVRQN